jgi:hypothetical protein
MYIYNEGCTSVSVYSEERTFETLQLIVQRPSDANA